MGWFLPVVPHPVVVWEVVVNNDCEMWSHRDGFPGVGSSGLVSGGFWVGRWGALLHCVLCVRVEVPPGSPGRFRELSRELRVGGAGPGM